MEFDKDKGEKDYSARLDILSKKIEEVQKKLEDNKSERADEHLEILKDVGKKIEKVQEDLKKEIKEVRSNLQTEKTELNDKYSELKNQYEQVDKTARSLCAQLTRIENSVSSKAEQSALESIEDKLVTKIATKATRADVVGEIAASNDVKEVQIKHSFNTCVFLCVALLLNIVATWVIMCRPGNLGQADSGAMPWIYIISLFSIMLVNIAATAIWICHFAKATDSYGWEIVTEIILLIFGTVTMWLFAFHPQEKLAGAAIALAVFLTAANLLAFVMRIVHFTSKYKSADSAASFAVSFMETLFCVAIFIIFVWAIRI